MSAEIAESRWEHGSQFHWLEPETSESTQWPWADDPHLYWGKGRDALQRILEDDRVAEEGRVWVPSYFCQKVVGAMAETDARLVAYRDDPGGPFRPPEGLEAGDAIVVVNRFGLGARPEEAAAWAGEVTVIEDHSHDPLSNWARDSRADWCFASLRKSLPLPDGAVSWSPQGHHLGEAPEVDAELRAGSRQMLQSMLLKRMYLRGLDVRKEAFREAYKEAEATIGGAPVSGMTESAREMLASVPAEPWREQRRDNWRWTRERLAGRVSAEILRPRADEAVPYAVVCRFESAQRRQRVRQALIERRIYPAALWPMDAPVLEVPDNTVAAAEQLFCLQCDMRYRTGDMARVVDAMVELDGCERNH